MYYTFFVEYIPTEFLKNSTNPIPQPLKSYEDCRSLKSAVSKVMKIDLREFSQEIVLNENLPRQIVAAGIIDPKLNVIANLRILEQFENINIPKGVYLHIDKPSISIENFERKADFPISSYVAHGPRSDYFLLRSKTDLATKTERQYKAVRKIKPGSDFKKKI